jgi:hypothetical protein
VVLIASIPSVLQRLCLETSGVFDVLQKVTNTLLGKRR